MKNSFSEIKDKIIQRYNLEDESLYGSKSTNINVLLNRVKLDKKRKSKKNTIFSGNITRCNFIWYFDFLKKFFLKL